MGSAAVAYTDPQGVFDRYEEALKQSVSYLTNLHWRPSRTAQDHGTTGLPLHDADTTIRTVPQLKLRLMPEGKTRPRQHQILGLNNTPFVQMLVLETAPLEIYRSKLRQIGKDWFTRQVDVREPTGYVVVHTVSENDSPKATKAIWTRLTAEFDPANCVQLKPTDKSSWNQLKNVLQGQLLAAFDARVEMLELEIKKHQATRDVPGWNFGTTFAMYEGLSWAYESMSLLEDALKIYNMLDSMVETLPASTWQSQPQTPLMDSAPERDSLIDPILSQTASYFDVKRHLLFCKIRILMSIAKSKRQQEENVESLPDKYVSECVKLFISKVPLLLGTLSRSVGDKQAQKWLLKAVREFFVLITEVGSSKLAQGKGELLLLERDAVQKLGAIRGWKIPGVFNDISLTGSQDDADEDEEIMIDDDEKNAAGKKEEDQVFLIQSEAHLVEEFLRLTNQIVTYHQIAKLPRSVTRLTAQAMLIEYHRGNVEKAWDILIKTPSLLEFSSRQMPILSLLEVAMSCAEKLEHTEKVNEFAWRIMSLDQPIPLPLFERAIAKVQQFENPKPATHDLNLWFEAKVYPYLKGDEKGYFLELELIPKRPGYPFVPLSRAQITAEAHEESTQDGGAPLPLPPTSAPALTFTCDKVNVGLGHPSKLYTSTFREGVIELTAIEARYESHVFTHGFTNFLVSMAPLSSAFTANVTLARQYTMRKRSIELQMSSPRTVHNAKVHIQPSDPQLQLLWEKAEGVKNLQGFDRTAKLKIPALVDQEHFKVLVNVTIEYNNDCRYSFSRVIDFTLAISVDFQEYFRQPPRILSQFFVKPFSTTPITFISGSLASSQNYQVNEFASTIYKQPFVAFNNAPVSYVFDIRKREQPDRKQSQLMQLTLVYRSMLWECQQLLYKSGLAALTSRNLGCYSRMLSRIVEELCANVNMAAYATNGAVVIENASEMIKTTVHSVFQYMNPEHAAIIEEELASLLSSGLSSNDCEQYEVNFDETKSELMLEVPDPDAEFVHYVELELHEGKAEAPASHKKHSVVQEFVVGSVITANLKIETVSFQENDISNRVFEYELDRSSEGWSYTGKVKGTFKGGEKVDEKFSLIPNRSGEILMPNILIKPANLANQISSDADSDQSVALPDSDDSVVVAKHANTRILVVPEINMLAITF